MTRRTNLRPTTSEPAFMVVKSTSEGARPNQAGVEPEPKLSGTRSGEPDFLVWSESRRQRSEPATNPSVRSLQSQIDELRKRHRLLDAAPDASSHSGAAFLEQLLKDKVAAYSALRHKQPDKAPVTPGTRWQRAQSA
ncbi:MAG: hypothetical protein ACI9W2_001576 [Gammaproteobacteria bacterium]|jgi:hypothetical protein